MSETPRTDDVLYLNQDEALQGRFEVMRDFARTLELEVADELARVAVLESRLALADRLADAAERFKGNFEVCTAIDAYRAGKKAQS